MHLTVIDFSITDHNPVFLRVALPETGKDVSKNRKFIKIHNFSLSRGLLGKENWADLYKTPNMEEVLELFIIEIPQ